MNNFLLLIPLLAILGGIGFSFDSVYGADEALDDVSCVFLLDGEWTENESLCKLQKPYSLPSGDRLEIPTGVTLEINSSFENNGIIDINGKIVNYDTMINYGSVNAAFEFVNNGELLNDGGTITNYNSFVNAFGTFKNQGEFRNAATGQFENMNMMTNNGGTIENEGTFTNSDAATLNNYNPFYNIGNLDNYGIINTSNNLENSGTLNNHDGGTITNTANFKNTGTFNSFAGSVVDTSYEFHNYSVMNLKGDFYNRDGGMFANDEFALLIISEGGYLQNQGSVYNGGEIRNDNRVLNSDPSMFTNNGIFKTSNTFDNNGTFENGGTFDIQGGYFGNYGTFTVNVGSTFTNNASNFNDSMAINDLRIPEPAPAPPVQTTTAPTGTFTLGDANCNAMGGDWSGSTCTLDQNYTLSAGDEITIPTDVTLIINAEFKNEGRILNFGDIINEGMIDNLIDIINEGMIDNFGDIFNHGMINNLREIYNEEYFSNNGVLYIANTEDASIGFLNYDSGVLANQGDIKISNTGEFSDGIKSWGHLKSVGLITIDTMNNDAAGISYVSNLPFDNYGTIDIQNNGGYGIIIGDRYDSSNSPSFSSINHPNAKISISGSGTGFALFENAELTNNGLIEVQCLTDGTSAGMAIDTMGGTFTNYSIYDECNPPAAPPGQPDVFTITAQECQDNVGPGRDGTTTSWIDPILDGYAGTCEVTGPWLMSEHDGPDTMTLIIDDDLILSLKDGISYLSSNIIIKVNGALVLDNTLMVNRGTVEINSGEFVIYPNGEFYNVGSEQTVNISGQNSPVLAGSGLIAVDSNSSATLEGLLKNSGAIENSGTFNVDLCTGSLETMGAGDVIGTVNEIACNNQPTNPPANPGADTTAPVISVPRNAQLQVETAGAVATQFFRATAVDETDGNVAVNCNFPQNNQYRVGTSTITCTAVDNSGNTAQKSFSVNVAVADANAVTCGTGTELFAGECRAIPARNAPVVQQPVVQPPVVPQVQETVAPIGLIATVTDNYENGVTTLDIKFNKNFVNYEIEVTQNGDTLLRETDHALGTSITYKVTAQGSVENPIDVKLTSLGIGLPGQESRWTGPTGLITNVQVVPEFGTIAMMILVVAIVSVVAITSKSRLMTKF